MTSINKQTSRQKTMQGEVLVNLFVPWSLWDTPRWICAGYQRLFSGSWRKISLTCQECFPYLNTVRSSSDMTVAYCSVGCLPICLLQQTSCLLISWAHSYLRLLFFLPRHFLVQLDLRLLLGRGVIGLGNLGAISFVLILRLLHKHWHFFASLRRKMTFWPCLTFKVGPFTTIYCRQIRNKLENKSIHRNTVKSMDIEHGRSWSVRNKFSFWFQLIYL